MFYTAKILLFSVHYSECSTNFLTKSKIRNNKPKH